MSDAINSTVAKMRDGSIHNVAEWDVWMANIGATKEDEIRCLMACAIKTPEQAMLISTLFAAWRGRQYPASRTVSTGKIDNAEAPAHANGKCTVDDIICLEGRNADANKFLRRWGRWWKVSRGYQNNTAWLLTSLYGGKNKREEPKTKAETHIVGKAGDMLYNIVNVIKFPCSVEDIP